MFTRYNDYILHEVLVHIHNTSVLGTEAQNEYYVVFILKDCAVLRWLEYSSETRETLQKVM